MKRQNLWQAVWYFSKYRRWTWNEWVFDKRNGEDWRQLYSSSRASRANAMKKIPLELRLLRKIDLALYLKFDTGRRFNFINGQYVEADKHYAATYEAAEFGELVLDYSPGKHRLSRITIIYARVVTPEPEPQYLN